MSAVTKPPVSQSQAGQRKLPIEVLDRAKQRFEIAEFFRRLRPMFSKASAVRLIEKISTLFVNNKKFTRFQYA
ncbi:MAG: hypothetical protein QW568_02990 [Candidatus Anstonellaceae archaeon]